MTALCFILVKLIGDSSPKKENYLRFSAEKMTRWLLIFEKCLAVYLFGSQWLPLYGQNIQIYFTEESHSFRFGM